MRFLSPSQNSHFCYIIKSIIIPQITPIAYNNPNIFKFSFKSLFTLNNTNIPIPEPTSRPPIIEPKEITCSRYSCVNTTDPAQFGINPKSPAIIGPTTGIFKTKFAKFSSPINSTIIFTINVIIIINNVLN